MCAELEELLTTVRDSMPGLRTELQRMKGGMATLEHVAVGSEHGGKIPHVGGDDVVRHDILHLAEPEEGYLRQDLPLAGDAVG